MILHPRDAGKIGELAVILQLKQSGYTVFTEVGDNSPVDLIVLTDTGRSLTSQVKSCSSSSGKAELSLRKAGPHGYLRKYRDEKVRVDFFALNVHDTGQIAYISAKEAFDRSPANAKLTFRLTSPRNGQNRGVHYLNDDADFEGVLRDYEQRT